MKVILLEDVKSLGKKGDVVNVNDGYARNFLLKTKKGIEANGKNMNDLKLQKANADKVAQENLEAAKELGEQLAKGKIEVSIKTGEGGKVFGSVSSKEIAQAAEELVQHPAERTADRLRNQAQSHKCKQPPDNHRRRCAVGKRVNTERGQ